MAFDLTHSTRKTGLLALISMAFGLGHGMDIKEVSAQCLKSECRIDLTYDLKGQAWPKFFQDTEDKKLNVGFTSTQVIPMVQGDIAVNYGPFVNFSVGPKGTSQGTLTQLTLVFDRPAQKAQLKKVGKNILRLYWVNEGKESKGKWVLSESLKKAKKEVKPAIAQNKPVAQAEPVKPTSKPEPVVSKPTPAVLPAASAPKNSEKPAEKSATKTENTENSTSDVKDLSEFVGKKESKGSDVTSSKTFTLKSVSRSVFVTADVTNLYEKPTRKSKKMEVLHFGNELRRLDVQGEFYKVESDMAKGYVARADVSYDDELTKEQRDELMELAKKLIERRKNSKSNDSVQVSDTFKEAWKSTQRLHYSSFGRRDPFIPLKNVEVDGISIDEIRIVGIIWDKVSPLVILEDVRVDGVSYTLREGDPIINGKVYKINPREVIFQVTEFGVTRNFSIPLPSTEDKDKK